MTTPFDDLIRRARGGGEERAMTDWKQDFVNESEKAAQHYLVREVIDEFIHNINRDDSLIRYGLGKIAIYVAQIARAQALGIDPETLRSTPDEVAQHMARVAQIAADAGVPVIVVEAPESDA